MAQLVKRFEPRHWQNFIYQLYNRKDENKEKEAGNSPTKETDSIRHFSIGLLASFMVFSPTRLQVKLTLVHYYSSAIINFTVHVPG